MKKRVYLMMDKNKKKSGLLVLSILIMVFVFAACSPASEPESLAGYIVLKENTLYLDEVEVITTEDLDRITGLKLHEPNRIVELDLTDRDMPNGYYIHNVKHRNEIF